MPNLPTGTVTFLFTDVEGSTDLWEQYPDAMRSALARHDAVIEFSVEQHRGLLVRPRGEGDSCFAVFARASDAVGAAYSIQRALVTGLSLGLGAGAYAAIHRRLHLGGIFQLVTHRPAASPA